MKLHWLLFIMAHQILSCSVKDNFRPRDKPKYSSIEIRNDFSNQLKLLDEELKDISLLQNSKQSKKIISDYLKAETSEQNLESAFELGFLKLNAYFNRSHYWLHEFDRSLAEKNQQDYNTGESIDELDNENFLTNSLEYQMLQVMRERQEAIIDEIAGEFGFLLKSYQGLPDELISKQPDPEKKLLEEKLRYSVVAAKFLTSLTEIEKKWRSEFPLIFDGLFHKMQFVRVAIGEQLKQAVLSEDEKKFQKSKSKIIDSVINIDFNEVSPLQGLSNREIDLYQTNAYLQGEHLDRLPFVEEIEFIENEVRKRVLAVTSSEKFEAGDVNLQTAKCIKPSMTSEGNISGSEFPKNHWALTFDDGPSIKYSAKVLDYLREENVRASFFLVAGKMKANKNLIIAEANEGHIIASHSWSHANLPKVGDSELDHEILAPNAVHEAILKQRPKYYRCPYGAGYKNANIRERIVKENMVHVLWNVDTLDWQDKNPDSIVKRALDQMAVQKRGVILFHDTHEQSLLASRALVKHFHANPNIAWLTVRDAVEKINKSRGCVDLIN
jgi:peptidoglycan/xylan/chitin deacetylase (PgdA/CDA1 family)